MAERKVMLAMDGTVPRAVGVVVGSDDIEELVGQGMADELNVYIERVHRTVADKLDNPVRYLAVFINENGGVENVVGFADGVAAGAMLREGPAGDVEEPEPGHWCVTYDEGQDSESYGHVFEIPEGVLW